MEIFSFSTNNFIETDFFSSNGSNHLESAITNEVDNQDIGILKFSINEYMVYIQAHSFAAYSSVPFILSQLRHYVLPKLFFKNLMLNEEEKKEITRILNKHLKKQLINF